MTYWIPFKQFGNLPEERIIEIRQISEEEEDGLFDQLTTETYVPVTESDLPKPPQNAVKFKGVIRWAVFGMIETEEVEGYKLGDTLYLEFDE